MQRSVITKETFNLFDGKIESIVFTERYDYERSCWLCTGAAFLKASDVDQLYVFDYFSSRRDLLSAQKEIYKTFLDAAK